MPGAPIHGGDRISREDIGILRAICAHALARDLTGRSPCRNVRLPAITPTRRRVIAPEQLATLADELGEFGPMAYIAATTGLRRGEVAGLRVRALDLLDRKLSVEEQVTRGIKGRAVVGPPKSDASRRSRLRIAPQQRRLVPTSRRRRTPADALRRTRMCHGPQSGSHRIGRAARLTRSYLVGKAGFEPAASASRRRPAWTRRD